MSPNQQKQQEEKEVPVTTSEQLPPPPPPPFELPVASPKQQNEELTVHHIKEKSTSQTTTPVLPKEETQAVPKPEAEDVEDVEDVEDMEELLEKFNIPKETPKEPKAHPVPKPEAKGLEELRKKKEYLENLNRQLVNELMDEAISGQWNELKAQWALEKSMSMKGPPYSNAGAHIPATHADFHAKTYPWMHAAHKQLPQKTAIEKLEANPQLQFGLLVGLLVAGMLFVENFRKIRRAFHQAPQHKLQLFAWALFLPLIMGGYLFQPSQEDPSHLITFASGVQLFGFVLLWVLPRKPCEPGSQGGDSAEFALLMAASLIVRLVCTYTFQGYLPTDPTGDGCYQVMELLCALISLRGLVRLGLTPKQAAASVGSAIGALILAKECHGSLDSNPFADTAWAASVYLEAMAWYFMLRNLLQAGVARRVDSGFMAPAFVQSVLRAIFWFLAADEVRGPGPATFFPDALVATHIIVCVSIGLTSLLVYLAVPVEDLPFTMADAAAKATEKTVQMTKVAGKAPAQPLLDAGSAVFGDHGDGAATLRGRKHVEEDSLGPIAGSGMVPIRAVYEEGKLHIEYKNA